MQYIEALQVYQEKAASLFLAGGISHCPDWQQAMVAALNVTSLVILNPRRSQISFDEQTAQEQITWEYMHLRKATAISFWFPKETLCPITLYELGAWSMTNKKLFIGAHPDYQRIQDVRIQTALARPEVQIVTSLEELVQEIVAWTKTSL